MAGGIVCHRNSKEYGKRTDKFDSGLKFEGLMISVCKYLCKEFGIWALDI